MARILVVGGSLGGLLAANILLRAGHRVQVIEKAALDAAVLATPAETSPALQSMAATSVSATDAAA